jgi:hypothetical protein
MQIDNIALRYLCQYRSWEPRPIVTKQLVPKMVRGTVMEKVSIDDLPAYAASHTSHKTVRRLKTDDGPIWTRFVHHKHRRRPSDTLETLMETISRASRSTLDIYRTQMNDFHMFRGTVVRIRMRISAMGKKAGLSWSGGPVLDGMVQLMDPRKASLGFPEKFVFHSVPE